MSYGREELPGRRSRSRAAGVAFGGFLLPLLAFRSLLDPRQILVAGDLVFFHLPLRTLFRRAVSQGVPWWNGAIHGGQPILSNPNYAAFYPPSWLVLILPPATAIHLILLLHVAWAYAGAWRLTRHLGCRPATALFAALGFTLGGFFVSSAALLTLFCGLAWTPWILLWACRTLEDGSAWPRSAVLVGLGLAAQFLAGEPVDCILSGIALAALALDGRATRREPAGRLAVAILLAVALAGVQLLPTLGRVADSGRAGGLDAATITHRSMPPVRLLELAVPHPLGDPMRIDEELFYGQRVFDEGFPYLVSIYPGLLVLVLALGGLARPETPRRWAWLAMLGAGVFLALGRFNPLYVAIVPHLPILDQTRYPEKMLLLASAVTPILAALCLEARLRARRSAQDQGTDLATLLSGLLLLLLGALSILYLVEPQAVVWLADTLRTVPLPSGYEAALESWARRETFFALLVAATALLLLGPGRRLPTRRLEIALLALLAADLVWNDRSLLPVAPRSAVDTAPTILAGHPPGNGRLFTDFALAREAWVPLRYDGPGPDQLWNGIETLEPYVATLWGYDYVLHHDYDLMLTTAGRQALSALEEEWRSPDRAQRLLGAWGVGTVARERPLAEVLRQRFRGERAPRVRIETNSYQLPRVRWVPRVAFHADPGTALRAARDDGYRFGERAHWVGSDPGAEEDPGGRVAPAPPDPAEPGSSWSHLVVDSGEHHSPYLQIARTWDANWRATIDGEPAVLYLTASGQMGLVVPSGAHRIVLRYLDVTVPAGAGLTLLGLLASLWLWRRRRAGAATDGPAR